MKITGDNIIALDNAIKAVCPVDGVNSAGAIAFREEASAEERAAAQAIMDAHLAAPDPD